MLGLYLILVTDVFLGVVMSDSGRVLIENPAVAACWLGSDLNWLVLSSVGVLSMPVWYAAVPYLAWHESRVNHE